MFYTWYPTAKVVSEDLIKEFSKRQRPVSEYEVEDFDRPGIVQRVLTALRSALTARQSQVEQPRELRPAGSVR